MRKYLALTRVLRQGILLPTPLLPVLPVLPALPALPALPEKSDVAGKSTARRGPQELQGSRYSTHKNFKFL
jgi:hypothetical protein